MHGITQVGVTRLPSSVGLHFHSFYSFTLPPCCCNQSPPRAVSPENRSFCFFSTENYPHQTRNIGRDENYRRVLYIYTFFLIQYITAKNTSGDNRNKSFKIIINKTLWRSCGLVQLPWRSSPYLWICLLLVTLFVTWRLSTMVRHRMDSWMVHRLAHGLCRAGSNVVNDQLHQLLLLHLGFGARYLGPP